MRTSTQLKALIRNLAKAKNVEAEVILRNFMLERFLERVSLSRYRSNFILKGGVLISAMLGIDARATMDMDMTVKKQAVTDSRIREIIENILSVPVQDNVNLSFRGIESIRKAANYPGYRISIDAVFDKTRQTMHIDLTTGDPVTPKEIEYSFRLMFEDRRISILTYNLETVLAEKFEAIVTNGLANTRMRDFYDIYALSAVNKIDAAVFRTALGNTATRRNTSKQIEEASTVIKQIASSKTLIELWNRYRRKHSYASETSWEMAMSSLRTLNEAL